MALVRVIPIRAMCCLKSLAEPNFVSNHKSVKTMKALKTLLGYAGMFSLVSLLQTTNASALSLDVTANPLWTDTGIYLSLGQSVTATASGSWNPWTGVLPNYGPDGVQPSPDWNDSFLVGADSACLIAYVGSDPFQGHGGDASFFPQASGYWVIGSSGGFTSPVSGELWLGFNDAAVTGNVGDNSGFVTANITVVPEPGIFTLAGVGVVSLLLYRRRG